MTLTSLKKSDDSLRESSRQSEVAKALGQALASTFTLYLKSQNYHWNVEGSRFVAIHKLTEDHYLNMFQAVDEIAERIRALGFYAPGTMKDFLDLSQIKNDGTIPMAEEEMIADLAENHGSMVNALKEFIKTSEEEDDTTTTDMLSDRRKFHEEAAWMLKSLMK